MISLLYLKERFGETLSQDFIWEFGFNSNSRGLWAVFLTGPVYLKIASLLSFSGINLENTHRKCDFKLGSERLRWFYGFYSINSYGIGVT